MDLNAANSACWIVVGVMALVGLANLVDFGLRTMAENKAQRAEQSRLDKWGLPSPRRDD